MKIKDMPPESGVIKAKTIVKKNAELKEAFKWWEANSKAQLAEQVISTVGFLKQQQAYRYRQASIFARLYGNIPLFGAVGTNFTQLNAPQNLPIDRPTMNVVQSCVDTLGSRLTQNKPRPIFLTEAGDYKQRKLAKQLNNFIDGELYQTEAYRLGEMGLKYASVLGTGCLKVYEDTDKKRVAIETVLQTELLVDPIDALYGKPRQLFQLKLVDRSVLQAFFNDSKIMIGRAVNAYPEAGSAGDSIADQVMVVEAWHLPSTKEAKDGLHVIACSEGILFEEVYTKDKFPFAFLHYNDRLSGFWGQPLTEQLLGTQIEINKLLMTISRSINLVGVPRIFVEEGSKVAAAQFNDEIGSIIKFRGTKPIFEVAPCMPQEVYAQLQRLVDYAYQQSGISQLSAAAQKPAGLDSGEALRSFDNIQSDRFASLQRRYDNLYIDLSYLIIDLAKDIGERDGTYETVYPGKDGTSKVDLPKSDLLQDPFVIQCYDTSSLPKDPAGRKQYVIEMMQAGIFSQREGRRLLAYPDLEQEDKLANAAEERILKILDEIVEEGKETPPDPFMDLQLAQQLTVEYYNLYVANGLGEAKAEMLRNFSTQIQAIIQQSMQPPPGAVPPQAQMPGGGASPQAVPQTPPTSDLLPTSGMQAAG